MSAPNQQEQLPKMIHNFNMSAIYNNQITTNHSIFYQTQNQLPSIQSNQLRQQPQQCLPQLESQPLKQYLPIGDQANMAYSMQMQNSIQQQQQQQHDSSSQDKNVYSYSTNSTLYAINFQNSDKCRLAIGTLERSANNRIEILELVNNDLAAVTTEPTEYPCTKLMWSPNKDKNDLLASSSDCIRLYQMAEANTKLSLKSTFFNKKSKYCGPLTSFDWNRANDSILGTASIDTTCTIWDLNKSTIRTQLIAHDKEVFDISFSNDENIFISSGADGSIRLFDLRELDHSTIIYETKDQVPIIKLAWNMNNNNLIAALSWEKSIVYIFDSRVANVSLLELKFHKAPVTSMAWSPNHQAQICSVSEDQNVIITYVPNDNSQNNNVSYIAPSEINNVSWCTTLPEWIGITFKNQVQMLRK